MTTTTPNERASAPPVDHAARTRATQAVGVAIALSAGAGSGKTSVLTGRILQLLEEGIAPSSLAAITFTDKAAGEILARVRDRLEERVAEATRAGDMDRAARLQAALASFGALTLSTLHSFCRDLLRHESLEAAFAPTTEVGEGSDDDDGAALFAAALERWRAGLGRRRPLLRAAVDRVVSWRALMSAVVALERYRHLRPIAVHGASFDAGALRTALRPLRNAIASAQAACAAPASCKLIARHAAAVALVDAALVDGASGDAALLRLVLDGFSTARNVGRAADWGGADGKAAYVDALDAVVDACAPWRQVLHGEVLRDLQAHVVEPLVAQKAHLGVASFDDLLLEAARLLRERPAARRRLRRRYAAVLIDEVQDTDPVQADIARLLTGIDADKDGDDEDVADAEPGAGFGRLFAVGDPRQSIYRFRGADVATFDRLEAVIAARGERLGLTQNFRSTAPLVAWVNHAFAGLPGYAPQSPRRGAGALDPVVVIEGDVDAGDDEVGAVVAHVQGLLSSSASIVDKETGASRAMTASDVMVLLPSWAAADRIADALRAHGVPAVVEGGDRFFARDEVRLAVAALRAVVEPTDTEAVAFALRGLLGVSVAELAAHVAAGGALRPTVVTSPARGSSAVVPDALALLRALHHRRGDRSLCVALDELFAHARVAAVWALLPDCEARLANLDKLRGLVRELEASESGPLAVVSALQRRARAAADKDIDRIDDDGDAVRVTTLFKAKGLEAPVVVLMCAVRKKTTPSVIVDHAGGRVAVRLGPLVPPGWDELVQQDGAAADEERRRWMYVAATRARDQLVICRFRRRPRARGEPQSPQPPPLLAPDIHARGLPPCDPPLPHEATWSPSSETVVRVRHAAELRPSREPGGAFGELDAAVALALSGAPSPLGDVEGDRWLAEDRARTRAAERACLRWRAATSERASLRASSAPMAPSSAAVVAVSSGGAASARVGRVVHAVMERLDLAQDASVLQARGAELSRQLGRAARLSDDETARCASIVARILEHPKLALAQAAPERWHEVPFTFASQGGIVSGTIDLCFPLDAARRRWVVFDWKSSVPPEGSPKRARYEAQLAQYAQALLANLGDIEIVERAVIGPHAELSSLATPADDAAAVLADAPPALAGQLGRLLDAGAEVPALDTEPEHDVAAVAAVVFFAAKVAVGVEADDDQATATLVARGWRIVEQLDDAAAMLGLAPPAGLAGDADDDADGDTDDDAGGDAAGGGVAGVADVEGA